MSRAKRILPAAIGALAALGLLAPPASARVESEIAPPDKRHVSVEKAANLAKQTKAAPLPAEIVQPFAPPGFELTDAEEAAAAAAAARMVAAGTLGNPAGPAAPSDRDLLESIVGKIRPRPRLYGPTRAGYA